MKRHPRNLRGNIDRFVEHYLSGYAVSSQKSKYIHDPLWGTVEIRSYEQCVLDTPLLQRLRQIHQTGCVFATYPSARHTRFEHTLGVMHLAGRMAQSLRRRYPKIVSPKAEQRVRLAALFHDTGHSVFSHTSEEIYRHCSDLSALLSSGGEFEDKGAGEVLSYLIVTSDAFRAFYSELQAQHSDLQVAIEDFAPLILSRSPNPQYRYEADIISGAFDADKLDYFPRDGRAAGLVMPLDVDRLFHCMELALVRGKRTLVISRGGYNAVQQLLFARATLFSTVYHHHKVRACDCMVKGCFEYFGDHRLPFKKNSAFSGVDLQSAADYLFLTDADFFNEAYNHQTKSVPHSIIHALLYRRLLKRVLTISSQTIQDFESSDEQKAFYGEFYNLKNNPRDQRQLSEAVRRKAHVTCSPWEVWFDLPTHPTFGKAGSALINFAPRGSRPVLKKLSHFIPVEAWVETYRQYYAQSFLFGPPDPVVRTKLAIAGLQVLDSRFGLKLNQYAVAEDIRPEVCNASPGRQAGGTKGHRPTTCEV